MARAVREAERLDVPGRRKRSTIPTIKVDREAFGKFAEAFARFMGTARFLFGMTVVIVIWILWNLPYGPPRPRFEDTDRYVRGRIVAWLATGEALPEIAPDRVERALAALERDGVVTRGSGGPALPG